MGTLTFHLFCLWEGQGQTGEADQADGDTHLWEGTEKRTAAHPAHPVTHHLNDEESRESGALTVASLFLEQVGAVEFQLRLQLERTRWVLLQAPTGRWVSPIRASPIEAPSEWVSRTGDSPRQRWGIAGIGDTHRRVVSSSSRLVQWSSNCVCS